MEIGAPLSHHWLLLFTALNLWYYSCQSFYLKPVTYHLSRFRNSVAAVGAVSSNDGKDSDGNADLLSKASELRREASELEATLRRNEKETGSNEQSIPRYDSIAGSTWTLTYGFSSEPPSKDNARDEGSKAPLRNYRGKLSVNFRLDGFTDMILHEASGIGNDRAEIMKVWGWDQEQSREDGKQYLLFSMDAQFPDKPKQERVYLQARVDEENGFVVLKEGTVTVKREYIESNIGFFSMKGILAQFRRVGQFSAKPSIP